MKNLSKTQRKMVDALTELCRTIPFDEITIRDICQKANISRSTFYYNYNKKDDIFIDAFEVMYFKIFGERNISENYYYSDDYLRDCINMYDKYTGLLIALEKWDVLDLIIRAPLSEMSELFGSSEDKLVKEHYFYYSLFMIYPYYYVLMSWIKKGKKESREEMFEICKHFLWRRDYYRNLFCEKKKTNP